MELSYELGDEAVSTKGGGIMVEPVPLKASGNSGHGSIVPPCNCCISLLVSCLPNAKGSFCLFIFLFLFIT